MAFRQLATQGLHGPVGTSSLRRAFSTSPLRAELFEAASSKQFESRVLNASGPSAGKVVLVDFYADWCMPCKMLSPTLKKLTSNPDLVGGKELDLMTVDTEAETDLARQFKISAMPTVLAFKDGQVVDGFVGMLREPQLVEFIKKLP